MTTKQKAAALLVLVVATLAGAALTAQAVELVMPTAVTRRAQ